MVQPFNLELAHLVRLQAIMVWLQYDDPTIYATYRGRYALLRWIRQSEEFRRKVRILVNKTTHIWPEEAEVL